MIRPWFRTVLKAIFGVFYGFVVYVSFTVNPVEHPEVGAAWVLAGVFTLILLVFAWDYVPAEVVSFIRSLFIEDE
jgi:hypothetical protein